MEDVDFTEQSKMMDDLLGIDPEDLEAKVEEEIEDSSKEEDATEEVEVEEDVVTTETPDETTTEVTETTTVVEPTKEESKEGSSKEDRETNEKLRAKIEELSSQLANRGEKVEKQEAAGDTTVEDQTQPVEFISNPQELAAIFQSPKALNDLLNKVLDAGRQYQLQTVSSVIPQTVQRQLSLQNAVSDFYQKNPDLTSVKGFVGLEFGKAQAANPDKSIPELLDITEKNVRESLQLAKKSTEIEANRRKTTETPAFAGVGGGSRGSNFSDSKKRTQQDQMAELIK